MIQGSPTDDTKLFNRVGSGDVNWAYYVVMERENPMLEIINVYRLAKNNSRSHSPQHSEHGPALSDPVFSMSLGPAVISQSTALLSRSSKHRWLC